MLEEERDDDPHGNRAKETKNQNKENQVHIKKLRQEAQERDKAKLRTPNNKTRDPEIKKEKKAEPSMGSACTTMMKKNRKTEVKKRKRRKIKRTESQDSRLRARRMTKTRENKGAPRRSTEMAKVAIDAEETNASLNMKREKKRKAEA